MKPQIRVTVPENWGKGKANSDGMGVWVDDKIYPMPEEINGKNYVLVNGKRKRAYYPKKGGGGKYTFDKNLQETRSNEEMIKRLNHIMDNNLYHEEI